MQDAIYQEMEQKDLEILRLKQQVAEVTEELAASDSTVLYPSLAPALKGDTSVIKKMHIHPTLRRDASTDGSHLDSDAGRSNHMPHEVMNFQAMHSHTLTMTFLLALYFYTIEWSERGDCTVGGCGAPHTPLGKLTKLYRRASHIRADVKVRMHVKLFHVDMS